MKKKSIAIGLLVSLFANVYAQHQSSDINFRNIIPPSPTAYSLGNYGNVPTGAFTGTINFSVPLITYKNKDLEIPVTLFYGSNGLRIDEISSTVGLGWSLNFGGVISRTIRDRPDDTSQKIQVPSNAFLPNNTPAYQNFIYTVGNVSSGIDTEADIYSFSFNEVSGKFFYDRNNQIHLIEQQALKIEKLTNGFSITKADGEKYYFTETEITNSKALGTGHQLPNIATTAWYLTKIVDVKGSEVYFTYEDMYLDYTASQSQNFTVSRPYNNCTGAAIAGNNGAMGVVIQNTLTISGKRIKTISSNNPTSGNVTFNYSTDNTNIDTGGNFKVQSIIQTDGNGAIVESAALNYVNTPNNRNFLSGIVFKDPTKSYSFDYESPSDFPVRLSYSRDYWGYYNAKSNNTLVPAVSDYSLNHYTYSGANQNPDPNYAKVGMLKKITYPTKGYTELEYEGNTYWGTKTIYPNYTYQNMTAANSSAAGIITQQYTLTSPVNQTIEIEGYSNFNGNCSQQTHNPIGRIELVGGSLYGYSSSGVPSSYGASYQFTPNQSNTITFDAVAGSTYTIKMSASRCTYVNATAKYYPTAPQVFDTNLDTGGVRIKSTKDFDKPSSAPKYTRYYYGAMNDINHSSGDKGTDPYFVLTYNATELCMEGENTPACSFSIRPYITLTSNSLLPLFDTDKSTSTFYKYVTISHGGDNFEKGGESKEFIINRDSGGSSLWGATIISTPYTNYGWNNGLEVASKIVNKKANNSLEVQQSTERNYEKNDTVTFELKNFTHRKNDLVSCQTSTTYNCTQYDTTNSNHACYGKAVGDIINMPYIDNVDVGEYRTISYWSYLKSQNKTEYFNGIPLVTQTEYFYNNPANYQLNKEKITLPDNGIKENNYSYAHEKGNQLLINNNMIGIPLETSTTQTVGSITKILEKSETVYPTSLQTTQTGNLVLPLSEKSYDKLNNAVSTDVTYDKYDDKGNLLQYTTKDGIPVSIIWGYNKTQPIAKVEGIAYDQLTAAVSISGMVTASDNDAADPAQEGALLSALNNFRKEQTLSGKLISTYTYDPLIGVTSITPPSGLRQIFTYDTAGRLKNGSLRTKNSSGNYTDKKVSENKYNYKP